MKDTNTKEIFLSTKEDANQALERVYAWYEGYIIDRPPVQFSATNTQYNVESVQNFTPQQWKQLWFNTEEVIDDYIKSIEGASFLAETFPIYWPNLGPDVYAAFYGAELTYGEITSWSHPCVSDWDDISRLKLDKNNEYWRKIEELTACALDKCHDRYLVGYTDLHPGMDCVCAWRGMQQLCFDLMDNPDRVKQMVKIASRDFIDIYDHYDQVLKDNGHLSVTWIGMPSFGKFHVPSCDFAAMLSPEQFDEFVMPYLFDHTRHMDHNVFHLDGKDVAVHMDKILAMPEICAIQWVQGVGEDQPIMQWIDHIRKMRSAGKGVIVELEKHELEDFIEEMPPEGIYLCIAEQDPSIQQEIIKRLRKWKG